jgi:hypothetical protein
LIPGTVGAFYAGCLDTKMLPGGISSSCSVICNDAIPPPLSSGWSECEYGMIWISLSEDDEKKTIAHLSRNNGKKNCLIAVDKEWGIDLINGDLIARLKEEGYEKGQILSYDKKTREYQLYEGMNEFVPLDQLTPKGGEAKSRGVKYVKQKEEKKKDQHDNDDEHRIIWFIIIAILILVILYLLWRQR